MVCQKCSYDYNTMWLHHTQCSHRCMCINREWKKKKIKFILNFSTKSFQNSITNAQITIHRTHYFNKQSISLAPNNLNRILFTENRIDFLPFCTRNKIKRTIGICGRNNSAGKCQKWKKNPKWRRL